MSLKTTTTYVATDGSLHHSKAAALRQNVICESTKTISDLQYRHSMRQTIYAVLHSILQNDVIPHLEELIKETKQEQAIKD